jgi:glucose/arabinose dehydrogenase
MGTEMGLRRAGAILLAFAAGSCVLLGDQSAAGAQATAALELKRIGNFATPVHVAAAPGFPRLLFVVEKRGRIAVLRDGGRLSHPFLDIRERVNDDGERGLLSIAFPSNYRKSRRFYVYYTRNNGDNAVVEFKRSRKHPARAVASSRRRVLVIPHPDASNHNGGQLQFGPEGDLYIATGDGGSNSNTAAHLDVLLGKLLRIDPRKRHGHRYTVPSRNPYVGRRGRNEIYAYGLRNPWRFSFDSASGRLAIGDVGEGSQEEVDYATRAAAKGANFGWPRWEGDQPHPGDPGPDPPTFPIFTYPHPYGCAVVGGYVVHDPGLPALAGRYVYTDLCHGDIRSFVPSLGGASDDESTGLQVNSPTSFGEGSGGRIYVASFGGGVFRLRASP